MLDAAVHVVYRLSLTLSRVGATSAHGHARSSDIAAVRSRSAHVTRRHLGLNKDPRPQTQMHEGAQTHATRGVVGGCRKSCRESLDGAFVRSGATRVEYTR